MADGPSLVDGGPDGLSRHPAGYRAGVPHVRWPGGAGLAVSIVVNLEEGAELSLAMGDERNEAAYEVTERVDGSRDLCMESHFEYGSRAGWPRVRTALADRSMVATLSACGRSVELMPWLVQDAVADGHEVAAHGWRWERHAGMPEDEERAIVDRTVAVIRDTAGSAPVGWHTRSATSVSTRRLLVEHGGFLYDSNAYHDDLPVLMTVGKVPHVVLPYAFDTNDMRFYGGGFVQPDDFARYCIGAIERLHRESATEPRMLSIGLHPRIIGRPGRIGGLEAVLDHIAGLQGVWVTRRDAIAHAWRAAAGLSAWAPAGHPRVGSDA